MKECSNSCIKNEETCPFKECKHWINFDEDHNCDLISINRHGAMTLREIAPRLRH